MKKHVKFTHAQNMSQFDQVSDSNLTLACALKICLEITLNIRQNDITTPT